MRVRVDLDAIRANARAVRRMVDGTVVGVVKGVGARRPIVDAFVDAGVDAIAVSRVEHLHRLRDVDADLVMIRTPARSEIGDVVSAADVTLHGSPEIARLAGREAARQGVTHRVVPLVDAGANREGVPLDAADGFLDALAAHEGIEIHEVGVNLGCFHEAPDPAAVHRVADRLPDYPLSVGGSGMVPIRDDLPASVASYRVGDAILTGKYVDAPIEGLRRGSIQLHAEVLASRPGEAVVDVGNVTTDPRHLVPLGEWTIERWTNEQTVIRPGLPEGRLVAFEMEYDAIATTFNSRYV